MFGIGVILFDVSSPANPQFDIRVLAGRQEPDMFYANKYMRLIDIFAFGALDYGISFAEFILPRELKKLQSWYSSMAARPSARA